MTDLRMHFQKRKKKVKLMHLAIQTHLDFDWQKEKLRQKATDLHSQMHLAIGKPMGD
jgi:hypothetical protein